MKGFVDKSPAAAKVPVPDDARAEADFELQPPNAGALIEAMRSVGYTVPTAIADIIDNSLTATAQKIWISFHWARAASTVTILDDGRGMTEQVLSEAMRPGSANPLAERSSDDLGRFGLGLKTASFSQCRQLTVWTKALGAAPVGRCWDLDYVTRSNEWRLLRPQMPDDMPEFSQLASLKSGTLVIWRCLDRIVDESSLGEELAHQSFLRTADDVAAHLSMIFHRFLAGGCVPGRKPVRIHLNDPDGRTSLKPWNPFSIDGAPPSQETPSERIRLGKRTVTVRGFVLPHRDRLTESQFMAGGGPRGWIAQQGFYIYRNDRLLVAGDWLRLGRRRLWTKDEHYKLARLSINIPNTMDVDWSLDIKKSTARPPAALREKLTDIGEHVRNNARSVFVHRGEYGPRPGGDKPDLIRPWETVKRDGYTTYRIDRNHPLVADALKSLGPLKARIDPVLRLLEETVPVQRIWLDIAESDQEQALPYQFRNENELKHDLRQLKAALNLQDQTKLRATLLAAEPFNRYAALVDAVLNED